MAKFLHVFNCLFTKRTLILHWTQSTYTFFMILAVMALPWLLSDTISYPTLLTSLFTSSLLALLLPLEQHIAADQANGWLTWYLANYRDGRCYFLAKVVCLCLSHLLPILLWIAIILSFTSLSLAHYFTFLQGTFATGLILLLWGCLILLVMADPGLQGKSTLTLLLVFPFLVPSILISYRQIMDMVTDNQLHYYGYQWGLVLMTWSATTALSPLVLQQIEA